MRRAAIVGAVLLLAMDTADACHKYSRWLYPWPQSCRATALAPRATLRMPRTRINVHLVSSRLPARPVVPTPEIALPSLTDIEWGHDPAEVLRERLLLLGYYFNGREDK